MLDWTAPGQKAEQITPRGSSSGRMHSIIEVTAALPEE
jgi:putative lipoic acid-binding regulatory protein